MTVTIRQIADDLGISPMTVSRVMRGEGVVADVTRKRVLEQAAKLGYRPNAAARAIASRRTRQVAVLVANEPGNMFQNPAAYHTILGLNHGLEDAGYMLTLARLPDMRHDLQGDSRIFQEHLVDGLIVLNNMPEDLVPRFESLVPNCIWVNTDVWRDERCLCHDDVWAGRRAARGVVEAGYHTAIWLDYAEARARRHYSHHDRLAAVTEVLKGHSVRLIVPGSKDEQRNYLEHHLKPGTAIITSNTGIAQWAAHAIVENTSLRRGRDFGLVACDDEPGISWRWPNLARVSFDRFAEGVNAARMMIQLLESPNDPCPSVRQRGQWMQGTTLTRHTD